MYAKNVLNSIHASAVMGRRVQVLAANLSEVLSKSRSVLDVGCGDGSISKTIQSYKPGLEFSGIDVFLRPSVSIPAHVYDGEKIPYPDASFDFVTIVDVLHHTDDPTLVLRECVRVAKKGVVLKDHLVSGFGAWGTLRFLDWIGNFGHDVRLPYNYLTKDEWKIAFENAGCESSVWKSELNFFPFPFSLAFDRSLHFISMLEPKSR